MTAEVKKQEIKILPQPNHESDGYDSEFRQYYNLSLAILKNNTEDVSFGPHYFTENRAGNLVTFYTFVYSNFMSGKDTLYVLGYTEEVKPAGYRKTVLKPRRNYLHASGHVIVGYKGEGLGTCIEMVHEDFLSRCSHTAGIRLIEVVFNLNLAQLENLINEWEIVSANPQAYSSEYRKNLQLEINDCKIEQQRWQSIFGEKGKFGYRPNKRDEYKFYKYYPASGDEPFDDLSSVDQIFLRRREYSDNKGVFRCKPVISAQSFGNPEEIRADRILALFSLPALH